ncbi:Small nuclear ribonucleoprotein-associated protein B [Savitreella phatthalungensis]
MQAMLKHRVRLTLNDSRTIVGQLLAFDTHLNLVLADAEEYRNIKRKRKAADDDEKDNAFVAPTQEKRTLGLTIIRGEHIIATTVEGPPPTDPRERLAKAKAGSGTARPIGRGAGASGAPLGQNPLGGPINRGVPPPPGARR